MTRKASGLFKSAPVIHIGSVCGDIPQPAVTAERKAVEQNLK